MNINIGSLLNTLLNDLKQGNPNSCYEKRKELNELAMMFLDPTVVVGKKETEQGNILYQLLEICNILYNNTTSDLLPIEDGIYDLLREKYNRSNPDFQVGADMTPIMNVDSKNAMKNKSDEIVEGLIFFPDLPEAKENGLFLDDILGPTLKPMIDPSELESQTMITTEQHITKRRHDTQHEHPELIGTLDKCKFVLCTDAEEIGVLNDPNVNVLERDFFAEHIRKGIISPKKKYTMVCELKYDGVSVEADCSDIVKSARSRGDTGIGQASDMSPLLEGYRFPKMDPGILKGIDSIGVKFEAIIQRGEMEIFSRMKNYPYANCRTAIVGLTNSADGGMYRDLITLVPLQVEENVFKNVLDSNRIMEIEFLNEYFMSKGCPLRYSVITGTYVELLFQIKKFLEEAEYARSFIPFMYDGIVVSYVDPEIREALGRENFINKYSMAVKFDPMQKQTIFRGYSFTVGQEGTITPMIHYDPVEFYGTVHTKSSGHSYKRFMELGLRVGDIIDVKYINDVMPYVSKPMNEHNANNHNPIVPFPEFCPFCGGPIEISPSMKSAKCINQSCSERSSARMVNMFSKLNLAEFGEATIAALGKLHLCDVCMIRTGQGFESYGFGPGEAAQLNTEIDRFLSQPIKDYELFGSLGFTNVAAKTWKLIFQNVRMDDFIGYMELPEQNLGMTREEVYNRLLQIKGIGKIALDTIFREYEFFIPDIHYCLTNCTVETTFGKVTSKQIRATGFRNQGLFNQLCAMGYDASGDAVTKQTDILLVPYEGFVSSKTQKVSSTCQIVSIDAFLANMDAYL